MPDSIASPSCMPSRVSTFCDPLAGEEAHQVVLQRQVEAGRAGVALPAGAAAELVVDAPATRAARCRRCAARPSRRPCGPPPSSSPSPRSRATVFVHTSLGTSSRVGYSGRPSASLSCFSRAQASVSGLPPRMMSVPRPAMFVRDGHRADAARPGRRSRPRGPTFSGLAFSSSCLIPRRLSMRRELLALGHVRRADQDRPAGLVHLLDLVDDRVPLLLLGAVDEVAGG